ncbi:preprotein translocase subunit SecG [Urbifossiella limnaea]|uniref:Protein-export membrane protein SecG n=1 Tax=Urbifossiella limnaea TaxID=2528023 RepID=A0A517XY38_9BACT|nr:preprotein translocase subunit SecG [Urbifossiella limnaea]QDU22414.1 preprotein translocase subunit SecG [Urbifossiella limnaea]
MSLLAVWWVSHVLNVLVVGIGLFLMLIVLIQRGKGGGLAGAFGGAGGSSAFGSRAADAFVKITLYLAAVWVLVIMIHVKVVKYEISEDANVNQIEVPAEKAAPAQQGGGGNQLPPVQ